MIDQHAYDEAYRLARKAVKILPMTDPLGAMGFRKHVRAVGSGSPGQELHLASVLWQHLPGCSGWSSSPTTPVPVPSPGTERDGRGHPGAQDIVTEVPIPSTDPNEPTKRSVRRRFPQVQAAPNLPHSASLK